MCSTTRALLNAKIYALMLDWFWTTRKQSSGASTSLGEMRGFHDYLGAGLTSVGKTWKEFGLAVDKWTRIKKDSSY